MITMITMNAMNALGPDVASETRTIRLEVPRAPFKECRQQLIESFEYHYLRALLQRSAWNIGLASRWSRLSRDQLLRLIGKHGLCPRCDRPDCGEDHR
jgi:transcriptional regulator with GAF, ATPase, and Fis domain